MMKILIVTDAWLPQVNGVVRTLQALRGVLEARGHEVAVVSPDRFRSFPCPSYPEIRLGLASASVVWRLIFSFYPDARHIATKGTHGLAAAAGCLRTSLSFMTVYTTPFPDWKTFD